MTGLTLRMSLAAAAVVGLLSLFVLLGGWTINLTVIFGSGADHAFTPLHTYFMSPTGNDSNNGLTTANAWATPNHAVVCGDVIIAQAGTYNGDMSTWGTVSSCPSASGGIDGAGGINAAVLLCGGSDLRACVVNCATAVCNVGGGFGPQVGITVNKSNWSVQGWRVIGTGNSFIVGYQVVGCTSVTTHVSFINDTVENIGQGFEPNDCGNGGSLTADADYVALIGLIAQNAAQINFVDNGICIAALDVVVPGKADSDTTHTHWLLYNNYVFNNLVPNCDSHFDGEDFMLDTIDNRSVVGRFVIANNIGYYAERYCINFTYGAQNVTSPTIRVYNNTCYDNNQRDTAFAGGTGSEITNNNGSSWVMQIFNNIAYQPHATNGIVGSNTLAALYFNPSSGSSVIGAQYAVGAENIFRGSAASCGATLCDSTFSAGEFNGTAATYGTNTYVNPDFKNTTDLISNHLGMPDCTGFMTTTACVGWNAATQTMTSLSILDDLTPNATGACSQCSGKGFQNPGKCVSSGELFNDYPSWLKGIVYLHASGFVNGAIITEKGDLVTKPCGM